MSSHRWEEVLQPLGPHRSRILMVYREGREIRLSAQHDDELWSFRLDPDQASRVGQALLRAASEASG